MPPFVFCHGPELDEGLMSSKLSGFSKKEIQAAAQYLITPHIAYLGYHSIGNLYDFSDD